jgi:hypothetical protein
MILFVYQEFLLLKIELQKVFILVIVNLYLLQTVELKVALKRLCLAGVMNELFISVMNELFKRVLHTKIE